jgi:thiamine biosynthesis protein ThiC
MDKQLEVCDEAPFYTLGPWLRLNTSLKACAKLLVGTL